MLSYCSLPCCSRSSYTVQRLHIVVRGRGCTSSGLRQALASRLLAAAAGLAWFGCYVLSAAPVVCILWIGCDAPDDVRMAIRVDVYRPLVWIFSFVPIDTFAPLEVVLLGLGNGH